MAYERPVLTDSNEMGGAQQLGLTTLTANFAVIANAIANANAIMTVNALVNANVIYETNVDVSNTPIK